MELFVFGLNHRTAPLPLRESWSFSSQEAFHALSDLRGVVEDSEHVLISTCNRTEFYCRVPLRQSPLRAPAGHSRPWETPAGQEPGPEHVPGWARSSPEAAAATEVPLTSEALEFYRRLRKLAAAEAALDTLSSSHFYLYRHDEAVEHLFRLAGGLDSMILGESQILKQIKDAFALAKKVGTIGRFFHQLFPAALRVGKRIRSGTGISEGCITPGQAAVKLATATLGDLSGRSALLVGSGKIATLTAQAFHEHDLANLLVVNRTAERAEELVEAVGAGATARWEDLDQLIVEADLVISSTGSVEPIVTRKRLAAIQERRGGRQLVTVDLAVPRDFAASCQDLEGVHLFNFDDLNQVIEDNISRRHTLVPLAEEIIRREVQVFQGRMFYLQVDPVLRHLVERFEQIRLGELQRYMDRLPPEYHDLLQELTTSLVKKLLHFPIEKLKSLRDVSGLNTMEVAFLKRLFLPRQ